MEGHYLYGLAYFYMAAWALTMCFCIAATNIEDFTRGIVLGILLLAHSSDEFWLHPEKMALCHLFAVVFMSLTFEGRRGFYILCLAFLMFLSDMFWVWVPDLSLEPMVWNFPHDHFYWQSILNLSFFAMCIITSGGCLNTLKIDRIEKRNQEREGDDTFEASEGTPAMDSQIRS